MNVDALAKLYYVALVVSTLAAVAAAVIARRHALAFKETNKLLIVGPIMAAVAALGFFAVVSGVGFYSPPNSCVTCHEMQPEYSAWSRSDHAHVTCLACHLKAGGSAGYLVEEIDALKEVGQHFTGSYPKIINRDSHISQKEMDSGVCERCHNQAKLGIVRFGNRVKVEHQPHLRLGITCQRCHNRVTHKGARDFNYLDGLRMMDGCMRCHLPGKAVSVRGRSAPTACSTCHPKDWAETVFGKPNVAKADFDECRDCHRLSDPGIVSSFARSKMGKVINCPDCHNDHLSRLIAAPDPSQCEQCHAGIAKKVVEGRHGGGKVRTFRRLDRVLCSICHPPHKFAVSK